MLAKIWNMRNKWKNKNRSIFQVIFRWGKPGWVTSSSSQGWAHAWPSVSPWMRGLSSFHRPHSAIRVQFNVLLISQPPSSSSQKMTGPDALKASAPPFTSMSFISCLHLSFLRSMEFSLLSKLYWYGYLWVFFFLTFCLNKFVFCVYFVLYPNSVSSSLLPCSRWIACCWKDSSEASFFRGTEEEKSTFFKTIFSVYFQ